MNVIEVNNLTKVFDEFKAVDNISFKLKQGEILGLLGPNGAGKTTTIQMLLGLTTPTAGNIKYFEKDFTENKEYCLSRMNFASAYAEFNGRLTLRESLRIFAGLYNVNNYGKKINELVKLFRIEEFLDKKYWKLSSGQKTRAILVKSLLNDPKLILMDEPTASLDPEIKNEVITLIKKLQKERSLSILYTSHDMGEVSRLCDRVMFLAHGKIVAIDTPLELTKLIGKTTLTVTFDGEQSVIRKYLKEKKYKFLFVKKHIVEITLAEEKIPNTLFGLSKRSIWITNININKPGLEDVFLRIANESKQN